MDCSRCHGLMIAVDMRELSSQDRVSGRRCLLCGETTDSGIEANRMRDWDRIWPAGLLAMVLIVAIIDMLTGLLIDNGGRYEEVA